MELAKIWLKMCVTALQNLSIKTSYTKDLWTSGINIYVPIYNTEYAAYYILHVFMVCPMLSVHSIHFLISPSSSIRTYQPSNSGL